MDHINPDNRDLSGSPREIRLLHIYSPPFNHAEAYIIGNRGGLEALQQSVSQALRNNREGERAVAVTPHEDGVFITDGEGYTVVVIRQDSPWRDRPWVDMALPYTDQNSGFNNEGATWPYDILTPQEIEKIYHGPSGEIEGPPLTTHAEITPGIYYCYRKDWEQKLLVRVYNDHSQPGNPLTSQWKDATPTLLSDMPEDVIFEPVPEIIPTRR